MKHFYLASILALAMTSCQSANKPDTPLLSPAVKAPATIEDAVASTTRKEENRKRDQYRHPVETLQFFGLKPTMTLVEIAPGDGWYTEILKPYMQVHGQYFAAVPTPSDKNQHHNGADVPSLDSIPASSADMVVTFRNVHNWMDKGTAKVAFKEFFKVLKPGGILGVVEHRANPKAKKDPKAKSGYVKEKDVIAFAKAAGFKLDAKSDINANPKDTKNYPEGVWTLPPSLRLKDKDREKYLAIGESDRMTLRFVKP